ncbi:MAG TPA: DinB family protein [Ktedonobacterales bacterium]
MAVPTMDMLTEATGRFTGGDTSVLETEGAKHTIGELVEALRMTRGKLQGIVERWSQAQLQTRPPEGMSSANGEDSWSATETVTHMLATQNWYRMNMDRLLGRRRQYDTMPRGMGDRTDNTVPKAELARRLHAETDAFLAEIAAIPADADLSAARDSTFFGPLTLRGWLFLALTHDTMHLAQIERLATYPTFPSA